MYYGGLGLFYESIYGDVHVFRYELLRFDKMECSGTVPGPRRSASCVHDPVRDEVVVFGGLRWKSAWEGEQMAERRRTKLRAIIHNYEYVVPPDADVNTMLALLSSWRIRVATKYLDGLCDDDMPERPVDGHKDGAISAHGAHKERMRVTAGMYALHMKSWTWRYVEPCGPIVPRPRMFHVMARLPDGRIYVFGGRGCQLKEQPKRADVWCFRPGERRWEKVHDGRSDSVSPMGRSGHTACLVEDSNQWYVFGGTSERRLSSVWAMRCGKGLLWREVGLKDALHKGHFADVEIVCA